MNKTLFVLLCLLPSTLSVVAAAWLAGADKPGWGWFLAIAVLIFPRQIDFGGKE